MVKMTHQGATAKPTQYNGTRYGSKGEAIFARWLDLEEIPFAYNHPDAISSRGWQAPFLISVGCRGIVPGFLVGYYLPCEPTDAELGRTGPEIVQIVARLFSPICSVAGVCIWGDTAKPGDKSGTVRVFRYAGGNGFEVQRDAPFFLHWAASDNANRARNFAGFIHA